jgi:hypothetical protein
MSLISKRLPFGGGVFWWGRKRLFGLRVVLYVVLRLLLLWGWRLWLRLWLMRGVVLIRSWGIGDGVWDRLRGRVSENR